MPIISFRVERDEQAMLKAEMHRRGCTYASEAVREMLGFTRSTPRTQAIPLLDQLELESPAISKALVDLIERHDQMRQLLTRIGRQVGLPRTDTELAPIGEAINVVEEPYQRPDPKVIDLPDGFDR